MPSWSTIKFSMRPKPNLNWQSALSRLLDRTFPNRSQLLCHIIQIEGRHKSYIYIYGWSLTTLWIKWNHVHPRRSVILDLNSSSASPVLIWNPKLWSGDRSSICTLLDTCILFNVLWSMNDSEFVSANQTTYPKSLRKYGWGLQGFYADLSTCCELSTLMLVYTINIQFTY